MPPIAVIHQQQSVISSLIQFLHALKGLDVNIGQKYCMKQFSQRNKYQMTYITSFSLVSRRLLVVLPFSHALFYDTKAKQFYQK